MGLNLASSLSRKISSVRSLLTLEEHALLRKYVARADYVRGLQPTLVKDLGAASSDGYFVMLKLSLAFSAIELLAGVANRKNNMGIKFPEFNKSLASGDFENLLKAFDRVSTSKFKNHPENHHLNKYSKISSSQDLTKFVSLCRNCMFHGAFTPNESGLAQAKKRRLLIGELAERTLDAGDSALLLFIEKTKQRSRLS